MRQCTTEDCEIGVELLEQSDLSARASAHLAMQAWTAFLCNRVAEGIADAERALALARATRDAHAEGLIQGALVPMLLANGQISNAHDEAERALTHARRLGAPARSPTLARFGGSASG